MIGIWDVVKSNDGKYACQRLLFWGDAEYETTESLDSELDAQELCDSLNDLLYGEIDELDNCSHPVPL